MADSSEQKSKELPIPALASILMVLAGVLVNHLNPLDSPRPTIPDVNSPKYVNMEDVNARLWQDPFSAILKHDSAKDCPGEPGKNNKSLNGPAPEKNKCPSKHGFDMLIQKIADMYNQYHKIIVLGVMVNGGVYTENIEERRRTRYAVLSGLAVKNYAPEDSEHIGYVEKLEGENLEYMPEKIPFEWFKDDGKRFPPVLILWLDDAAFASIPNPLEVTSAFVKKIKEKLTSIRKLKPEDEPDITFKFIGPASSDTLKVMIDELDGEYKKKAPKEETSKYNLQYYNAIATGDWPGIIVPDVNIPAYLKTLEVQGYLGISTLFTRTSLSDYQLAEALVNELALRGFELKEQPISTDNEGKKAHSPNNHDHIVIISEWDTVYGRLGLPKAMKYHLANINCLRRKELNRNIQCELPLDADWIHSFSYMRGLDGIIPGSEKTTEENKANKDKEKNNNAETNQERSEGQSQQDYLRRMAAHINDLKQELKNTDKGEIKAIGVLGSDAYDKLMILKALRPGFPKALFFTTDLDTRLMHPKEFDVTRNLIVAASFDLQLAPALQKSIPPFRDSYQTAHFFATQIALDNANGGKLNQEDINAMLGTARLFETGNNKAIALNYGNENKDKALFKSNLYKAIGLTKVDEDCNHLQHCKNAHPPPPSKNRKFIFALSLIIFVGINLCVYLSSNRFKKWVNKQLSCLKDWLMGCEPKQNEPLAENIDGKLSRFLLQAVPWGVLILIISVACFEINLGHEGEPFFWNEGVSVWPSEMIRLFAGILGCLFIVKTMASVTQNNEQLTKDLYLTVSNAVSPENAASIRRKYCDEISPSKLRSKIVICSGIFAFFAVFTILLFGQPSLPSRSDASYYANILVLGFTVPVFIVLVMSVFVITMHSIGLITKLDGHDSDWPIETLCHHLGLRPREAISEYQGVETTAPQTTLTDFPEALKAQKNHLFDDWLNIKFIAAYTKVTGKLIYYPFIILALIIFARSKIFDNWDMPVGLVIVFLSAAALTLGSAFYLRLAAKHARQKVIKKIKCMKMALSYQDEGSAACKTMEKQIDWVLAQIQEINEGAFQPLTNDPAIQAVLIPFGGIGFIALLENLVLNGF